MSITQLERVGAANVLADWFTEFHHLYEAYPGYSIIVCHGKFKDVADDEWWITQTFYLRLYDRDTGALVLDTPAVTMFKGTEQTFGEGIPTTRMSALMFTKTMPDRDWNLRLELVEWFMLSAEGANLRDQIRASVDFTILKSGVPPITPPPAPQPNKVNVYGMVVDEAASTPVVGAKMTLDSQLQYTDAEGLFYFSNVDLGTYTLRCEAQGFPVYSGLVEATETGEQVFQIMLSTRPVEKSYWVAAIPIVAVLGGVVLGRKGLSKKV